MIEPELNRFSVTCRTALPLKRNMLEMELVAIQRQVNGQPPAAAPKSK